jgi:hypothetical protein
MQCSLTETICVYHEIKDGNCGHLNNQGFPKYACYSRRIRDFKVNKLHAEIACKGLTKNFNDAVYN